MEKNTVVNVLSQFTKRFSTIFFDLDNTLIATRKADLKTCNKVSTKKKIFQKIQILFPLFKNLKENIKKSVHSACELH